MIGSAAQNIIALCDSIFLYHVSETDFAAIGFVGVFYLIITAIGYGFSRGGQILVARRTGEKAYREAGKNFYAMLYLEIGLAITFFLFIVLLSPYFLRLFVDTESIYQKSLEYLKFRAYGVFPSFIGVALIAFYTGIARTKIIMYDTMVLISVNIFLNYSLIYGKLGMPEMGIAGAGLASTLAEVAALIVFSVYMFFDKFLRPFHLRRILKIEWDLIKNSLRIASPIVAQAVVGLGSWFFFFGIIENMGERELAISNLVRVVYLILSIPCWGYSVGVNTLVSNFIGQGQGQQVMAIVKKTITICLGSTFLLAAPVLLFPQYILYPLLGSEDMSLFVEAQPIFYILFIILSLFAIGGIYFNGMVGTGATYAGLQIQGICAIFYVVLIYVMVNYLQVGLVVAWTTEIFYWIPLILLVHRYIIRGSWRTLEV
ncbi:MAG: MATE family efflux transporter, partial [Saprospiraceae bacterium]|nr:MATE family efflux transporter [Saprospiraceae bacterium]